MSALKIDRVKVLLVEDDEVDIESIRRAFKKINIPVDLRIVKNGLEALDELYEKNRINHIKLLPDLIIMDINMPKMNGIEFLTQLRANTLLSTTKIIILTTSDNIKDRLDTKKFNIHGYLVKPIQINALVDICKSLRSIQIDN